MIKLDLPITQVNSLFEGAQPEIMIRRDVVPFVRLQQKVANLNPQSGLQRCGLAGEVFSAASPGLCESFASLGLPGSLLQQN
jgi:hypothetical protein